MSLVVQKYGGSSVADVEKLRRVAARIAARRRAGDDVVVVVSAMGDTTDELLGWAAVGEVARIGTRLAITGAFDPGYCADAGAALGLAAGVVAFGGLPAAGPGGD